MSIAICWKGRPREGLVMIEGFLDVRLQVDLAVLTSVNGVFYVLINTRRRLVALWLVIWRPLGEPREGE